MGTAWGRQWLTLCSICFFAGGKCLLGYDRKKLVNMEAHPEKSGIELGLIYRSFIKDRILESGYKPVELKRHR
jgi:hypothetical protein